MYGWSLFVGIILFCAPSTAAAQTWPNEPSGSGVVVEQPFNSLTVSGITNEYGGGQIATDGTAPLSPPNILQECAGPGPGPGTAVNLWTTLNTTQAYVGFWFKKNYSAGPGAMHKITFLKSNGVPAYLLGYGNGWNLQWDLQPDSESVNNCHIPGAWGDVNCHLFPSSISLNSGTWYRIEYLVRTSTSSTSRNGIIKMWVNGAVVMNLTNVNWPGVLYQAEINPTWDGGTPHPTQECQWFDHYRIATDSVPTDTSPPNAPTNLTVTELWQELRALVVSVWQWLGPVAAAAETAVSDAVTISWLDPQDATLQYRFRLSHFAAPGWLDLGLKPSALGRFTQALPGLPQKAGDRFVCVDAQAVRGGIAGQWFSEVAGSPACNQLAMGPIVVVPPPVSVPVPTPEPIPVPAPALSPATVTMSGDTITIQCDKSRFTRAKTTGTGTKRIITCLK